MGGELEDSSVKSPVTMEIMDGKRSRMVHMNRLHHRVQPDTAATPEVATGNRETWYPPQVEHFIVGIPTPMVTPQPPLPDAAQPVLEQPPLVGEEEGDTLFVREDLLIGCEQLEDKLILKG